MEIVGIPIIVALTYALIEVLKPIFKNNNKFNNFIPLISALMGGVLGVVAFYVAPNLILASNVLFAFFIGLFSGLTGTGASQMVKQMHAFVSTKKIETDKEDNSDNKEDNSDNKEDNSDNKEIDSGNKE